MASHRGSRRSRIPGPPAACSAATVLGLGLTWAPAGPLRLGGAAVLLGAFVCALWIAHHAGVAAIAPALGLAVAFLVLTGLALAGFHVRGSDGLALALAAVAVAAAWSRTLGPAAEAPDPATLARLPHPAAIAGAVIFAAAAVWSVHYAAVSATADSGRASSLAVWAYPSGHRLLVGARQPAGRGPASLRVVVTHAGVTAAAWNDVHLVPGQVWRAPPLTLTGPGPTTVVARRGVVVVATFVVAAFPGG